MKKLAILGAGESGIGAALLGKARGYDVFVSDQGTIKPNYRKLLEQEQIQFESGQHTESLILAADEVVKSPGIPEKTPVIQMIRHKNIPVISELEFAFRFTDAKIILITGTNGKTTTTLLTYHLLRQAGLNVGVGGNVGNSFARMVIEDSYEYYVLEVSSFQLDDMYGFKADIAVLLNITPDHLDRYENQMELYINAKFRSVQQMTNRDTFIHFIDDPNINKALSERQIKAKLFPLSLQNEVSPGAFYQDHLMHFRYKDQHWQIEDKALTLKGKHNLVNSMAAISTAGLLGLSREEIISGLASFKNAAHRMEWVGQVNGVNFINDSKATNIDAVFYALESFSKPVVWIVGGQDKGNDYEKIHHLVTQKVKKIVCLGLDNQKIVRAFGSNYPDLVETSRADQAVEAALALALPGDTVILSPACASFDLFKNYEDRGDQFKQAVLKLKNSKAI